MMKFISRFLCIESCRMYLLTAVLSFSTMIISAQKVSLINLEKIPQRKVRIYIESKAIDQLSDFSLIDPSCKKECNGKDYHRLVKSYLLDHNLHTVWDHYRHANLKQLCHKHSVRFSLLLEKRTNAVVYADDIMSSEIDTGQVYFLNLKLLKGLLNIPVAFEIINIDLNKMIVEFSYIESNKEKGKQTIEISDNGDGRTKVVHTSYYKSESSFRDKMIYPVFHKKFVNEFHRDIKAGIEPGIIMASGHY